VVYVVLPAPAVCQFAGAVAAGRLGLAYDVARVLGRPTDPTARPSGEGNHVARAGQWCRPGDSKWCLLPRSARLGMGPVSEVTAHTTMLAHERIAVEDTAVATLKFANGALGVIEASTAAYPGYLKRIEVHGSEGSAAMEEEDVVAWDFAKKARGDAAVSREPPRSRRGRLLCRLRCSIVRTGRWKEPAPSAFVAGKAMA